MAVCLLLAFVVVAGPLAFGATEVWAYCSAQALVCLATWVWMLSGARARFFWLPSAVFALGMLQVVSVPEAVCNNLTPWFAKAQASTQELTGRAGTSCISVNRAQTLAALRRCLTLALIVFIVANIAEDEFVRRILLKSLAFVGTVVLLLGMIIGPGRDGKALGFHDLRGFWKSYKNPLLTGFHSQGTGNADEVNVDGIHYVANSPVCGKSVGALINENHFAASVGLTLPITISLVLGFPAHRGWETWRVRSLAGAYLVAGLYGVAILAQSRGGLAVLCFSGVIVSGMAFWQTRKRAVVVLECLTFATLLVAGIVFRAYFLRSLAGRIDAWQAACEMFWKSPWLGIGLGNYGNAYLAFRPGELVYYLAHNAWIEYAAETGVVGLALLIGAIAWSGRTMVCAWSGRTSSSRRIVRLGLIGSLLFAAMYGVVDHGIQVPGNACLCAVIVGVLLADIESARAPGQLLVVTRQSGFKTRLTRFLISSLTVFLLHGAWAEYEADSLVVPLRRAIARQRVPGSPLLQTDKLDELRNALPDGERAFEIKPRNAEIAADIAKAHLHLSQGRQGPELEIAADWFGRSLQLSPLNPWIRRTLAEMRARMAR